MVSVILIFCILILTLWEEPSLIDGSTVLGSIIGAIIAGGIGLFTTRYDRRLVRAERHLERHQDNLKVIGMVVNEVRIFVFPPWGRGYDEIQLPIDGFLSTDTKIKDSWKKQIDMISKFKITTFLVSKEENRIGSTFTQPIERLYKDLDKHFPYLAIELESYQTLIQTKGSNLLSRYYELCEIIYNELKNMGFSSALYGKVTGKTSGLKNYLEMTAQIVFNLALKVQVDLWPNDYLIYDADPDKLHLKQLAEKKQLSDLANKMLEDIKEITSSGKKLLENIENTFQETKLTGTCSML